MKGILEFYSEYFKNIYFFEIKNGFNTKKTKMKMKYLNFIFFNKQRDKKNRNTLQSFSAIFPGNLKVRHLYENKIAGLAPYFQRFINQCI